jgi:hypothetical protein
MRFGGVAVYGELVILEEYKSMAYGTKVGHPHPSS